MDRPRAFICPQLSGQIKRIDPLRVKIANYQRGTFASNRIDNRIQMTWETNLYLSKVRRGPNLRCEEKIVHDCDYLSGHSTSCQKRDG